MKLDFQDLIAAMRSSVRDDKAPAKPRDQVPHQLVLLDTIPEVKNPESNNMGSVTGHSKLRTNKAESQVKNGKTQTATVSRRKRRKCVSQVWRNGGNRIANMVPPDED